MRREKIVIWVCLMAVVGVPVFAGSDDERKLHFDVQYFGSEVEEAFKYRGHPGFGIRHTADGIKTKVDYAFDKFALGLQGHLSDLRRPRHFFVGGTRPLEPEDSWALSMEPFVVFRLPEGFRVGGEFSYYKKSRDFKSFFLTPGGSVFQSVRLDDVFYGPGVRGDFVRNFRNISIDASIRYLPRQLHRHEQDTDRVALPPIPIRPGEPSPLPFIPEFDFIDDFDATGWRFEAMAIYWLSEYWGVKGGFEWLQFKTDTGSNFKEALTQQGVSVGFAGRWN